MRWIILAVAVMASATFVNNSLGAEMIFADKHFVDTPGAVGISGTMKGNFVPYKNNTYSIWCMKDREECLIASIDQLNDHLMGRMGYPYALPIIRWDEYQVVAAEEPSVSSCQRTTITIMRSSQTATWVTEGINRKKPQCEKDTLTILKWSIE
jgi:hypothetical protein